MILVPLILLVSSVQAANNPLRGILGAENLKRAKITGVSVQAGPVEDSVILKFPSSETPGTLEIPVPAAGADWTRYQAFTFEFRSDSTIRWDLAIRNRKGEVFSYRVQPFAGVHARASIPASLLTREFMNNRQFRGYWISNWGNHIDLSQVEALMVRMNPNREVTLRLGPIALAESEVTDDFSIDKPVVDAFGQWNAGEWPGKVHSLAELRAAWKAEDAALRRGEDYPYCRYGGWVEKKERATGFFHTAQVDGRWWLVDPDGHLFFSAGMDCVRYQNSSRVSGREKLFAKLPPGAQGSVDFYQENAKLRYGADDFVPSWRAKQEQRLKGWGFNTIANWSEPSLFEKASMPYVTNVSIGHAKKNWVGFPDAYAPEYARSVEEDAVIRCAASREDRMLIGYFIGNEPRWPGRNLIERILADSEPSATQAFCRSFLKDRGDSAEARAALMETISRKYFATVADAIRKADPNHLVLGIRWAGSAPDPVLKANDVFEIFSINIYRFEPPAEQIARIHKLTGKPVMIGEFHFGAAERGYAPSLVMVKDQRERGVAYQRYVEGAAAQPSIVGAHYFQWVDQPVSGRFDGENYNLGFINQVDLPYPEMLEFAKATHKRLYQVHAGKTPAAERAARVR